MFKGLFSYFLTKTIKEACLLKELFNLRKLQFKHFFQINYRINMEYKNEKKDKYKICQEKLLATLDVRTMNIL